MDILHMNILKLAAFSNGDSGGNPAGVVIEDTLPSPKEMQAIAAEVGYSETAFATRDKDKWTVRYYSPESEVPFCGHATIALGAALAQKCGDGLYPLSLKHAEISVEGHKDGPNFFAALQSPSTISRPAEDNLTDDALRLFGYQRDDLDDRIPPAIAEAGATHLVLALKSRKKLADMAYDLDQGRNFMNRNGLVTVNIIHSERAQRFHSRNPFASGGVLEDPATGAAAAALAGYLRDLNWPHDGRIEINQGDDMGMGSHLTAEFSNIPGSSIRVSGSVRTL